jgi:hypothetical protein
MTADVILNGENNTFISNCVWDRAGGKETIFTMLWIIRQKTEETKEKRRSRLVPKGEEVAK